MQDASQTTSAQAGVEASAQAAPIVTLEHARKSFGSNEVLKDISLSVSKGDVLAVIGPSGGGKSTLLRCLTMLETLDAGDLAYGDLQVTSTNASGRAVYGGKTSSRRRKRASAWCFRTTTCSRTTPCCRTSPMR